MDAVSTPQVNITVTKGPSVTVAVLEMLDESGLLVHTITGEARRHPRDQENRAIGDMYALGRAFRTLSDVMVTWADETVETASKSQTAGAIFRDLINDALKRDDLF